VSPAVVPGKNYRKLLEQVAEQGAGNVSMVLQGFLRPPASAGGPFVLESAGFQVNIKAPRPAEPSGEPPPGRVGCGAPAPQDTDAGPLSRCDSRPGGAAARGCVLQIRVGRPRRAG
jgi:hypothetical protein